MLFCFLFSKSFGQSQFNMSVYLQGQFNKTIYDRTIGNNPWGIGLGLQAYLNHSSKVRPLIDFTGDAYLENDKVLRLNTDGTPVDDIRGMINLFAGASYQPAKTVYLSFVTGPSFVGGQTLLGIKPSFGFYFSENQRWTGKISYINIFNRDKITNEDFGSLSFSLGHKIF